MARDPEKVRAAKRRLALKKKVAKYGPEAATIDMRGRHGNHRRGSQHYRWNHSELVSSHGYALERLDPSDPLANRNGYGYKHRIVARKVLGRDLKPGEAVHHENENKLDNREENLKVVNPSEHGRIHMLKRIAVQSATLNQTKGSP